MANNGVGNKGKFPDRLTDAWREKIKVSAILNRLNNHALGDEEMTASQIQAAQILLKKTVPDLQSIAHTGPNGEGAVQVDNSVTIRFVKSDASQPS